MGIRQGIQGLDGVGDGMDRGQHVLGVAGLGDGVHVADRKPDRGGHAVHGGEHTATKINKIEVTIPAITKTDIG